MRLPRMLNFTVLMLILLVMSCTSCGGSETTPGGQPGPAGDVSAGLSGALPAPDSIKAANAWTGCGGSDFIAGLSQNVSTEGQYADFNPNCDPQQPDQAGLAWAIYALSGASTGSIVPSWTVPGKTPAQGAPIDTPSYYIGMGDLSRNRWDWYAEPPFLQLNVDAKLPDYLNGGSTLLIAIVVVGHDEKRLASLSQNTPSGGGLNLFFLHHSTGGGVIGGGVRQYIADYNALHTTAFEFWDHGYNGDGLHNASDGSAGCYNIPNDNTDPNGLHYLWTSTEADAAACRDQILANHNVIAFKSCFPASNIGSADDLQQYKDWYLAMLPVFDAHPDHVFVVMSTPPLHRLATNADNAARAREFANWLKSSEYLSGHPNVVCYDLFDALAQADDGSAAANMLRYDYEGDHAGDDSHPNYYANETVAPLFAQALIDASLGYSWPE